MEFRGLRPEAREAARDAARRSGMSVGEWLNNVIQPRDDDDGEPMRSADYHAMTTTAGGTIATTNADHRDDYRECRVPTRTAKRRRGATAS